MALMIKRIAGGGAFAGLMLAAILSALTLSASLAWADDEAAPSDETETVAAAETETDGVGEDVVTPVISGETEITPTVEEGTDDTYEVTVDVEISDPDANVTSYDVDVLFAYDTSGSMYRQKGAANAEVIGFLDSVIDENESINYGLITFGSNSYNDYATDAETIVNLGRDKEKLIAALNAIVAYRAAEDLYGAFDAAKAEFDANGRDGSKKIIIMLSDGGIYSVPNYESSPDALLAAYPDAVIHTIAFSGGTIVGSTSETILKTLAAKSVEGKYYAYNTNNPEDVFEDIATTIPVVKYFDNVVITGDIPENFDVVDGSFQSADDLTFTSEAGQIKVVAGKTATLQKYSFSYKIKINQDAAGASSSYRNNTLGFAAEGTYTTPAGKLGTVNATLPSVNAPIYKVSTSTDGNGTISASRFVGKGASYRAIWAANEGFRLSSVKLNDMDFPFAEGDSELMLDGIDDDMVIKVEFDRDEPEPANEPKDEPTMTAVESVLPQTADMSLVSLFLLACIAGCIMMTSGFALKRD